MEGFAVTKTSRATAESLSRSFTPRSAVIELSHLDSLSQSSLALIRAGTLAWSTSSRFTSTMTRGAQETQQSSEIERRQTALTASSATDSELLSACLQIFATA